MSHVLLHWVHMSHINNVQNGTARNNEYSPYILTAHAPTITSVYERNVINTLVPVINYARGAYLANGQASIIPFAHGLQLTNARVTITSTEYRAHLTFSRSQISSTAHENMTQCKAAQHLYYNAHRLCVRKESYKIQIYININQSMMVGTPPAQMFLSCWLWAASSPLLPTSGWSERRELRLTGVSSSWHCNITNLS